MLCATVIGLAALSLASLGFFVWCWLHFRDESESHPIYRADQLSCSATGAQREAHTEKRCAEGYTDECLSLLADRRLQPGCLVSERQN